MHLKSIVYLFFIFSVSLVAQDLTLSGKVVDVNNIPIAYTNVVLLVNEDATLLNGTTTDDAGFFKIDLKSGNYQLKVTYLGYKTYTKNINLITNTNLDTIILEEDTEELDGVLVVVKRPTVKRLVDRLVFDVENSTLSNNNVLDVLKFTPGVFVNDGKITVKNSEPIIYINDRRIHLSSNEVQQLLEGTSAANIKSIEVITNPPAKYEAEGGSVINIVTSKNIISGYNGSVFGNYKQGFEYPKYALGTSHFFKTEKLNTYINYNVSPRKDFRHNDEFVNFFDSNNINTSSWETDYDRINESSDHNLNANIDYDFNEFNSLGFSTNILISPRENTKINANSLTDVFGPNKVLDSLFVTDKTSVSEVLNLAFTLDYVHKFKREGEKISLSAHHTNYDYSDFQNVNTGYFFPNMESSFRDNRFQTFSSQYIKLYTGQMDYELPIDDSAHLEAGAKLSSIDSESILSQFNFENGESVEDLQNSDTFLYDEINYAAYVSYSKDWEHWSLQTGLRAEYTDISGYSLLNNELNESDYIKMFPSIYILNHLNDHSSIYFNYKKRIYRPRYNELNPFRYYFNDNTYSTGNPNLKPQIDDIITLGYTFNENYTFEFYYRYEDSRTLEIVYQDNQENVIKYVNTNIDHSISFGLDFITYTKIVPRWYLYALTSVFYDDNMFFALESNNELVSNERWSSYVQINNYFSFLKDESLTLDVSYNYISPLAEGARIISERSGLNLNLKKTLWDNKASLNIGVEDVFNMQNYFTSTKYLNQDVRFNSKMENRLFVFGFNYKFGNTRLKSNQRQIDLEELERLNKESDF
ncbi:outer membrane beta-barrel family protein [Confluentibacter flavum]|uniref:Glucosamine-6-phosphate deaminase n=1 Tax=Confluentibacter flavum TaxID=1909700 RepID=A0A2N3HGE3_9FLAO|nr:outer membrane beta-barrel family protein [Confluentibacter flavum]PKQ44047.1 glucosamine-6-phosphate deaminase [Confluentibacter flavum]